MIPGRSKKPETADIILITHDHYDHCSPSDIDKLKNNATVIAAPHDSSKKLTGDVRPVAPGSKLTVGEITIEAFPAYNKNKAFHPKSNNWVGYVVAGEGTRIYIAGDTDCIPEMSGVNADIALLPIGGTYTMNAKEASEAARIIKAKKIIPIHYGDIVGSNLDAEDFVKLCDTEVRILKR